jgi:K+-transporting ATPase KdpF subunit
LISCTSRSASAASHRWPLTSLSAAGFEAAMGDPLIGLLVAVGLGAYLVYTLVRPDKF